MDNNLFALFFAGVQQDFKVFLFAPVLCALFRAIFIGRFGTYQSFWQQRVALYHCFRYGFWWGMDFNAYIFLGSLVLVTLPGCLIPGYFVVGDSVRLGVALMYAVLLYIAFIGKLLFYEHYNDIYNEILWLGKKAEKHNLVDVFFNENHGWLLIFSCIPFVWLAQYAIVNLLQLPSLPYPALAADLYRYAFNAIILFSSIVGFYYVRYGGTLSHDDKPEWDTIPSVVKQDIFLARATVDDLVALENVWRHPLQEILQHSDAEYKAAIAKVTKKSVYTVDAFRHTAKGARITPPRHIFLIVGESYTQAALDDIYAHLHIADGGRRFRQDPHTASLANFLPAGMLSRPAIVSLMAGIFDARLELNEREEFWRGTVATALPLQLKKLGYQSIYWYGGNATYGNFNQFAPAVGFDRVMAATEFCPPASPKTWVGIYDHIFLELAAKKIKAMSEAGPTFHFIYTTSNHGPYKIPVKRYGYDAEQVMPSAPAAVKNSQHWQQVMGTYWYADQAISNFIDTIRDCYEDSLIIVTGDHAAQPIPLNLGVIDRSELTLREQFCTSFAMYHHQIDQTIFANNTIGGHMNIMPTLMELIAPRGFNYYSLFPSLTEPIDRVITPYHWLTNNAIGSSADDIFQSLAVSTQAIDSYRDPRGQSRFSDAVNGYSALTAWLVHHPELLQNNNILLKK